jgi:hypothetical protein
MSPLRLQKSGILGCLLIAFSGLALLYIFAWSTLAGGPFAEGGAQWWTAVLGTMFRSPEPGTQTYALLAILALGIHLWVRTPGRRLTVRRLMAWVVAIGVVIGVLVNSARQEAAVEVARYPTAHGRFRTTTKYANLFGITRTVTTFQRQPY